MKIENWMKNIVVLDIESTSVDPYKAKMIEFAMVHLDGQDRWHTYVDPGPGVELTEEVQRVTRITPMKLKGAPNTDEVMRYLCTFLADKIIVGHNGINYDFPLLYTEAARFNLEFKAEGYLCTKTLAQKLWPEFEHKDFENQNPDEGYSLGALLTQVTRHPEEGVYDVNQLRSDGQIALADLVELAKETDKRTLHGAMVDSNITSYLLAYAVEGASIPNLEALSRICGGKPDMKCELCPYKKHKGLPWENIPTDYLYWLVRQEWFKNTPREKVLAVLKERNIPLPSLPLQTKN